MTDDELDRLDALCAAATPGPWVTRKYPTEADTVRQLAWIDCGEEGHGDCAITQTVSALYPHGDQRHRHNAAFIAASRTALPALVAEVRRLRAQLAGVMAFVDDAVGQP